MAPRAFVSKAIITKDRRLIFLSMHWDSAFLTDQAPGERRLAPAKPTKAKIALHQITASNTARREKKMKRRLKLREHAPIVHSMSSVPEMTDRVALNRQRNRVPNADSLFLQAVALEEVQDRLTLVNKGFTKVAVITAFPEVWARLAPNVHIVSDEEVLDLEEGHYDLIVHALCLHWANDPVGQIIQCRRALESDGLFMCVTFGGQTLHELRASLAQSESEITGGLSPRVAPMAELRDLGSLLQRGGFALPVADTVPLKVTYETPWHLFRELREMGEGNALSHRLKSFSRREIFFRTSEVYAQSFMENGRIPATFELVFLTGWAPDASQPKPLRPGSAQQRLADALGVAERPLKD